MTSCGSMPRSRVRTMSSHSYGMISAYYAAQYAEGAHRRTSATPTESRVTDQVDDLLKAHAVVGQQRA